MYTTGGEHFPSASLAPGTQAPRTTTDLRGAEHAGCADEWLPRMAAALGACLVHAAHHAEYAASTLCGLSKSLHSTTIAASFCDEALCATVWQVLHQGSSLMDAVWW